MTEPHLDRRTDRRLHPQKIDRLLARLNLGSAHDVKVFNLKSHIDRVRARLSAT